MSALSGRARLRRRNRPSRRAQGDARLAAPVVRIDCHPRQVPAYQTPGAVGADLRADIPAELTIPAGAYRRVPTGVRLAVPAGFEAQVRPRSGLAFRAGVTILNAPGTVDPDYRGEVQVTLVNLGEQPLVIRSGDRIAQLVIAPAVRARFRLGRLGNTLRGDAGFGSTGV